jgi:hypothetical protein
MRPPGGKSDPELLLKASWELSKVVMIPGDRLQLPVIPRYPSMVPSTSPHLLSPESTSRPTRKSLSQKNKVETHKPVLLSLPRDSERQS